MTTPGNDTASTRDDELLARVYQQVTGARAARYAAAWDVGAGLARFRDWLQDHAAAGPEPDAAPVAAPPGTPPDTPSAGHGAPGLLEQADVRAALAGLPGPQREAIVLRYYAGLSEGEIAAAMGISQGAVKAHTARGLSALRAAAGQASPQAVRPRDSDDAGPRCE